MTRGVIIRNGRIVDPSQDLDRETDLLIEDGKVVAIGHDLGNAGCTIDATGWLVLPGLVDMHVELREPGFEEDEVIHTGTAAALAGGFTTIACLPSTDPPVDTQAGVEFILHQAQRANHCHVAVLASVSKGREGEQLAEIGSLVAAGAIGFTDAPLPIHNAELMRRALQYCRMFDRLILNRPRVIELTRNGIMHEGLVSTLLGLPGLPVEAEDVMTSRDVRLAEATGGRVHLMSLSSEGSVELVRRAKARGVAVTADVSPSHIAFGDEELRSFDPNFKLDPPLRSRNHLEACIEGLVDGTIDCIASAHAPRASEKKMLELDMAPFGAIGLETALATVNSRLIETGHLSWSDAVAKLSTNPARILGLEHKGSLAVGADGDVTLVDPHADWVVNPHIFQSKSSNTPFSGCELRGQVMSTIVGGQLRCSVAAESRIDGSTGGLVRR